MAIVVETRVPGASKAEFDQVVSSRLSEAGLEPGHPAHRASLVFRQPVGFAWRIRSGRQQTLTWVLPVALFGGVLRAPSPCGRQTGETDALVEQEVG